MAGCCGRADHLGFSLHLLAFGSEDGAQSAVYYSFGAGVCHLVGREQSRALCSAWLFFLGSFAAVIWPLFTRGHHALRVRLGLDQRYGRVQPGGGIARCSQGRSDASLRTSVKTLLPAGTNATLRDASRSSRLPTVAVSASRKARYQSLAVATAGPMRSRHSLSERNLAPRAGFEPATNRLTAGCSTAELPGNTTRRIARQRDGPIPNVLRHCKDNGPAIAMDRRAA